MDAITDCLASRISAPVAVARMVLAGASAATIAAAVQAARPDPVTPRWQALAGLLAGRALDGAVAVVNTGRDQTALGGIADIAAFFDRAAVASPEAGVALYSLGDPALLAEATAELAGWLSSQGLLPTGAVLDLGCGIGRVAAALAPSCLSVLGLDVSAAMVAEAQRRHGTVPNLHFAITDGRSLPPGPFGLVLAVDSMPYIHQAGAAEAVIAAAATALQPGGAMAVLNLSYGRSPAQDGADAERWATQHGLILAEAGTTPFNLWDGSAWVWRKRA